MFDSMSDRMKVECSGGALFCQADVAITYGIGLGAHGIPRKLKHESSQALTAAVQPDKATPAEVITYGYLVPDPRHRPMASAHKGNVHRMKEFLKIVHKPGKARF